MSYKEYSEYLLNLAKLLMIHSEQPVNQETSSQAVVYLEALTSVYPKLITILQNYQAPITEQYQTIIPKSPVSPVQIPITEQHQTIIPKYVVSLLTRFLYTNWNDHADAD